MGKKIKISAVSYTNTLPFVYGIQNAGVLENYELQLDNPAECARKLIEGEVDLGLIPVATISEISHPHILTNFCIGADGDVETVCVLSDVPINEVERIYLDYQSRTSVLLAKILADKHWKIEVEWIHAKPGFEDEIAGTTAAVVIGDRVFDVEEKHNYRYDLAGEWKAMTGLSFVFALWVGNKRLTKGFEEKFHQSLAFGLANISEAVESLDKSVAEKKKLKKYLQDTIDYTYDYRKDEAFDLYLKHAKKFLVPDKSFT